jgi:hypothetical protein
MQSTTAPAAPAITARTISDAEFQTLLRHPELAVSLVNIIERTTEIFRKYLDEEEPLWLWDHFALSNGGVFMAPDTTTRLRLYIYGSDRPRPRTEMPLELLNMSGTALGIAVCLHAFARIGLYAAQRGQLADFASQHAESDAIVLLERALNTPKRIARAAAEITVEPVSAEQVQDILRAFFGEHSPTVLQMAREEVKTLSGFATEEWNYFQVENGCVYLAPKTDTRLAVSMPGNPFPTQMSADAIGIVACIRVFARLGKLEGDFLLEYARALEQFAMQHAERKPIRSALG